MVFGRQTIGSIVQVLSAVNIDAVDVLFYKYFGFHTDDCGSGTKAYLNVFHHADEDQVRGIVGELIRETGAIRASADSRLVFDAAWRELERWLLHDGWTTENVLLVRLAPAAEEVTGVRDRLLEELQVSGLDGDGVITDLVEEAARMFVADPPDYNSSITKVRIALETIARRSATNLASAGKGAYSEDSWGKALEFLRDAHVLERQEEEVLARVYTFISPSAHVPTGITHEEWARLARTFGLGGCYFLLKKHAALKRTL
jgi:hypothetical protein